MIICEKCYADFDEEIIEDVFTVLCPKCRKPFDRGIMGYREEDVLGNHMRELTAEMRAVIDSDDTGDIIMSEDLMDFLYESMKTIINDDTIKDIPDEDYEDRVNRGIISQEEYDAMSDQEKKEFDGEED